MPGYVPSFIAIILLLCFIISIVELLCLIHMENLNAQLISRAHTHMHTCKHTYVCAYTINTCEEKKQE